MALGKPGSLLLFFESLKENVYEWRITILWNKIKEWVLLNTNDKERLAQIGLVMESVGIDTVELAEKLKAHVESCPGGQKCIEELLAGDK